jgi:hypothetical protein
MDCLTFKRFSPSSDFAVFLKINQSVKHLTITLRFVSDTYPL